MNFAVLLIASQLLNVAVAADSPYYGNDPLRPSPMSWVGRYLRETGAQSYAKAFAVGNNGVPGPARLVVQVSAASFPTFSKYFSNPTLLYQMHEPNSHILTAAYKDSRGIHGRLLDSFRFTQSGATLIPIVLTPGEAKRTSDFLKLANSITDLSQNVALHPWLLKDAKGTAYCPKGKPGLLSDWFMRMPIGEALDESVRRETYTVNTLPVAIRPLVTQVWSAPYGHKNLSQLLNVRVANPRIGHKTPAQIATSLLGSASVERIPVIFRFVNDHKVSIANDFNLWMDLEFDPGDQGSLIRNESNEI